MTQTPKTTLLLAIAIFTIAVWYMSQPHTLHKIDLSQNTDISAEQIFENGDMTNQQDPTPCALSFKNINPGDTVTFPLEIRGTIDNSAVETGCRWIMFEGQAGTAQLYYDNAGLGWDPIGKPEIVKVENWMSVTSPFSVTINYTNQGRGMSSGTKFKIRFTEENPSGEESQSYDLPVILK